MSESKIKELEARLKSLEDWQQGLARAIVAAPEPQTKPQQKPEAISKQAPKEIASAFPESLRDHLTITESTIKTEYVSLEKWEQINEIAKGLGYKWISDVKNSRWEK